MNRDANWTMHELELYHDNELNAARRDELTAALCREPMLREKLAALQNQDELTRTALLAGLQPSQHGFPATAGRVLFRFLVLPAVAAAIVLAVVFGWRWLSSPVTPFVPFGMPPSPTMANAEKNSGESVNNSAVYEPIRVVSSVPVRSSKPVPRESKPPQFPAPVEMSAAGIPFDARLNDALAGGRVNDALDLLDQASPAERDLAYRRIGEVLRSADAAERLLNSLPPAEQLAVVADWAKSPKLRPVAFARLQTLSREPALAEKFTLVVNALREDPALRSWLRSYCISTEKTAPQNGIPG